MNLSTVERGKTVTIVSVRKVGRALEERLAALGLFPGAKVFVAVRNTGAEIPFTRYFYKYQQPTPSEELEARFNALEASLSARIAKLFGGEQ